jgi:hypothetical protein
VSLRDVDFEGAGGGLSARERIAAEVLAWPGVTAGPGRRGEFAFKVGRTEIGHLHGESTAHFPFPKDVWADLIEQGLVTVHPLDQPGLAARRIRDGTDVEEVVGLMRINYDRIVARRSPSGAS